VTFKATPPGIISTIDLTTPVRQSASHVISLYNPLTVQVSFSTASTLSDILLPPNFTVPPQSEVRGFLILGFKYSIPQNTGGGESSKTFNCLFDLTFSKLKTTKQNKNKSLLEYANPMKIVSMMIHTILFELGLVRHCSASRKGSFGQPIFL
jgi:hypothetical protein